MANLTLPAAVAEVLEVVIVIALLWLTMIFNSFCMATDPGVSL